MAKRTSPVLTKNHLDGAVSSVNENINHLVRTQAQGFSQIDNRFTKVDERLDQMDTKLDAITEMLAMRKEMQNLIRQLKVQGITLDESKIFVS